MRPSYILYRLIYRFDDEEITFGDLADQLNNTKQFADGDASTTVNQPDEDSSIGPVEMQIIAYDVQIAAPPKLQVAVDELKRSDDDALDVTPARGMEVRNHFGDLVGWLDPGVTSAIHAPPRASITTRIVNTAWRGIKRAARVFNCCSCPPK